MASRRPGRSCDLLRMIERQMAGSAWAMGEDFSLADCAAAPTLFYGRWWCRSATRSDLTAYFERLKAGRPSRGC